jgi:sulfur-oxidizing protein SoxY
MRLTRRELLMAGTGYAGCVALASGAFLWPRRAHADDETKRFVEQIFGRTAAESDRIRLVMPAKFPTGYTVPMSLYVDCPMTETDYVRQIRVFAPKNPLIEVAGFHFFPQRSTPRVSTRVRLAKPQYVVAVAEMSDGALLMTKTWVDVATNGCI